jgi:transcriptional regulator with XRE-family HTH domain
MKAGAPQSFGAQLKAPREAAGFTQEELATISGLSVHAVSAERGNAGGPHVETVRALSAALDLTGPSRDALFASARARAQNSAVDELRGSMHCGSPSSWRPRGSKYSRLKI